MQVSAIIPAHNEAARIGTVIRVLKSSPYVQEVLVIDDGSTDGTKGIAEMHEATVIRNKTRLGKGQALERGVSATSNSVLFFCDADIEGLTPFLIEEIVRPVLLLDVEMCIGARKSKVRNIGPGLTYSPLLDGQRALTRDLWERVPTFLRKGYRVEVALNSYARSLTHRVLDISQTTKEQKVGIFRGTYERYCMYGDVALAHIMSKLQVK